MSGADKIGSDGVSRFSGGFRLEDLREGFFAAVSREHRFGTDAFLLADFASPRKKDIAADLCSGNGIVTLLMARDFQPRRIYAVELQDMAYSQLAVSVERSGGRGIVPVHGDLREFKSPEPLDVVVCNPPYKQDNAGIKSRDPAAVIARHETMCDILDVCRAAKRSLKFGGRLCLCNRPERLSDIFFAMRECKIEPKRLRTVHKTASSPPWLILAEGRLGGSSFMKIEPPLIVMGDNGEYSDEMKRIYKLG